MSAIKTHAFVLKTQDYRDTSLLVHFYTREYGKVHGIVKGIRDRQGRGTRFDGTLEPFSLNEIVFYRKKRGGDLHLVTQIELMENFSKIREDVERVAYASYFIDLLNNMTDLEDADTAVFDLLKDSLIFLSTPASAKRVARVYEAKLLGLMGLVPQLNECVGCQARDVSPAYFSVSSGGVYCRDCIRQKTQSGMLISRGTQNFLERVKSSNINELKNIKVSKEVGEELEKILRRFVDFHLPNKLKTVLFLEKMGY